LLKGQDTIEEFRAKNRYNQQAHFQRCADHAVKEEKPDVHANDSKGDRPPGLLVEVSTSGLPWPEASLPPAVDSSAAGRSKVQDSDQHLGWCSQARQAGPLYVTACISRHMPDTVTPGRQQKSLPCAPWAAWTTWCGAQACSHTHLLSFQSEAMLHW